MSQQVAERSRVVEAEERLVPARAYRDAVSAFAEVAATLSTTEDSDALLHVVARSVCELLEIARCSVYLRDGKTELFHGKVVHIAAGGTGEPEATLDARIKRIIAGTAADGFTDEILRTLEPVQLSDAQSDPRPVRSTMRAWGIRSILGVPMVLRGEVLGLLFLDDGGEPRDFTVAERELATTFASLAAVAIAQAQTTAKLRQGVQTITRQNALLRKAAEMDDRLTALALEGGSLQEIARAAAELTAKPCTIFDGDHRRLAAAGPAHHEGPVPRSLDLAVRSHPLVAAALDELGTKGSGAVGPVPAAGLNHRCLVAPIKTPQGAWGTLVISEHGGRFGALDLHIARRAATNAAFQLAAERRAAQAECDARASLATELVRGPADPAAATRRAEYLGIDLAAPHAVCLLGTRTEAQEGPRPSALDVAALLGEAGVDLAVLTAPTPDGVLAVLALDAELHPREAVARAREQVSAALDLLGPDAAIVAGISTRCTHPRDYVRGHQEARQVLRCVQEHATDRPGLVLTADDLGPGRLFLASASREDADRFARDALGPLLADGNEAMADLLTTLRVFFDSSRSVRRSAQALGVHENTIRYRLARIEELTRLAVASSSDDQLTAQLALLILRLEGWTPERAERPALASVA